MASSLISANALNDSINALIAKTSSRDAQSRPVDTKEALLHAREAMDTVVCAVLSIIVDQANLSNLSTSPAMLSGSALGGSQTLFSMACRAVDGHLLAMNFDILYYKLFKYCLMTCPQLNPHIARVLSKRNSASVNNWDSSDSTSRRSDDETERTSPLHLANEAHLSPLLAYYDDPRLLLLDESAIQISNERLPMAKLLCVVSLLQRIGAVFTSERVDWIEYRSDSIDEGQLEGELSERVDGNELANIVAVEEDVSTGSRGNPVDLTRDTSARGEELLSVRLPSETTHGAASEIFSNVPSLRVEVDDFPDIHQSTRQSASEPHHSHMQDLQDALVSANKTVIAMTANNIQQHIVHPLRVLSGCAGEGEEHKDHPHGLGTSYLTLPSAAGHDRSSAASGAQTPAGLRYDSIYDAASPFSSSSSNALHNSDRSPDRDSTTLQYASPSRALLSMTVDEAHFQRDEYAQQFEAFDDNLGHQISQKHASKPPPPPPRTLETDELLRIFCSLMVRQTHLAKVHWLAEYQFMTSGLLRDADELLGVEGYALATLEQCVYCITKEQQDIPINLRSLHIAGLSDPLLPRSRALIQLYSEHNRKVLEHSEGHNIPSMRTDLYPAIKQWIYGEERAQWVV
eukprot:gene26153-32688_t